MQNKNLQSTSGLQTFWLVVLRVLIGWYFLYEGLSKILTSSWSAYGYLIDAKGWLAPLFRSMAANPDVLQIVNVINMYGLTLVGLSLVLGVFNRLGYWGAVAFLALFCLSHPPLIGEKYLLPPEGSYLWVDKNLVMLGAVIVSMCFPTSRIIGLDRIIFPKK